MKDENKSEKTELSRKVTDTITKTIVEYCMKSDGPVDISHVVDALSDVLAAHLASMTKNWSDIQTEQCVNMIFRRIVSTMNDYKREIRESQNLN